MRCIKFKNDARRGDVVLSGWILRLAFGGLLLAASPQYTLAYSSENGNYSWAGGGDHDVPTPFNTSELRFELADGEVYFLSGRVVFLPSALDRSDKLMPHLSVDLSQYPWLANSKRIKTPFYPLEGSPLAWREWNHFPVKLFCKAHGRIVTSRGKSEYVITLEPVDRR